MVSDIPKLARDADASAGVMRTKMQALKLISVICVVFGLA
jgi:hypothetical protein